MDWTIRSIRSRAARGVEYQYLVAATWENASWANKVSDFCNTVTHVRHHLSLVDDRVDAL